MFTQLLRSGVAAVLLLAFAGAVLADCGWIPVPPSPYPPWPEPSPYQPYPQPTPFPQPTPQPTPQPSPQPDDWNNNAWNNEWNAGPLKAVRSFKVEEPMQKAVIAWNGQEEILVLSTNLKANRQALVLEMLPLPSQPTVERGDPKLFDNAVKLLKSKSQLQGKPLLGAGGPAGQITLEKKIGAHEIAVAHVLDEAGFVAWVEEYLKKKVGAKDKPVLSPETSQVIADYMARDFKYFAFDLIRAGTKAVDRDAIRYRFATDFLYYPLTVSRSHGTGKTTVQLAVMTGSLLKFYRGLKSDEIHVKYPAVTITPAEQRKLNKEIAELFAGESVQLRLWEVSGSLESFSGDLQVAANPPAARESP